MPHLLTVLAAAALTGVAAIGGTALPAAASTTLVEVTPANGATLERSPAEAVLTFADPLDPARSSATVTAPGQDAREVPATVDGTDLVVPVPDAGEGTYLVGYSVAQSGDAGTPVDGEVGFTVSQDGAPAPTGGAGPWAVASALAVVGMLVAVLVTVRRWQGSR